MKNISLSTLGPAILGLILCLADSASAQPAGQTNYFWSGGGDKTTWNQSANWTTGIVPVNDGTTFQIFIGTGFPTTSPLPITLGASDHVLLNDQLFGPEWGQTLNLYGTVQAGFGWAPVGALGGPKSTANLYTNSSYSSSDSIFLGDMFWFNGGPNVDMNLYDNAQLNCRFLIVGGHLNLYGGIVTITNALLTGTPTAGQFGSPLSTDATRRMDIIGGKMILPGGSSNAVSGLIDRGIFLAYGKTNDYADLIIDDGDTNYPGMTVVSGVPLGTMTAVHLQLPGFLLAGASVNSEVLADFTNVTNAVVTRWPGLGIVYSSGTPAVATVNTNGQVHAVSPGSVSITARIGALSNSVSITITSSPVSLVHRYRFSETSGTNAADSVGGPTWDGALIDGASFAGGQVVLDGTNGYVQLPAGILTNMDAVTIETWASFGTTISNWAVLFTFGDTDIGSGFGQHYISCQPHTGFGTTQIGISDSNPGFNNEQDAVLAAVQDGKTNLHLVAVYYPTAGYTAIYLDGTLAAINSAITISLPAAVALDPLNYIGRSLYANDPFLPVSVDEFRIYKGPLQASAIMADFALGPNQLIGTSTTVSLSASVSGSNLLLTWPTNSALVTLKSTTTVGAGASWSEVIAPLAVVNGKYQATLPATGPARFFRLEK